MDWAPPGRYTLASHFPEGLLGDLGVVASHWEVRMAGQQSTMPVPTQRKAEIVQEFARSANDSGSAEVQIALLTESVAELTKHLADHPKDNGTRRGLLSQVSRRARLLRYLKNTDAGRYSAIVDRLNLRG